ncbi:integrin alpha-L-like, partial [Micropterus dolomieu]|uniref:integrin alpha-L-like n=1 Tax=Micropterus dolomieu TaxID=147949 RepID=UPI001E8D62DA
IAATSVSFTFNINTITPHINTTEQNDFFGNKVLQIISGKNNGLVTAPQQLNRSEETCRSDLNQTHQCFIIPEMSLTNKILPIKHFGLSITEDATLSLYTSPSAILECNKNSFLNILDPLQQISCYTTGVKEFIKKTVDLVFLFDGSGSMTEAEFNQNKDFIKDVMKSLSNTSVKFAAVQFSFDYRMVFNFSDFNDGRALDESHMKTLTNTHKALEFVLEKIFDNPDAGASPDATKVLVLITDGDPSDTDNYGIIKRYNEKHVIRFVIGVKAAKLDKFKAIASDPIDKYALKIENYDELIGMMKNFHNKIFTMEGGVKLFLTGVILFLQKSILSSWCAPAIVTSLDVSSIISSPLPHWTKQPQSKLSDCAGQLSVGSSTHFNALTRPAYLCQQDTLILGSVGTNSWRGFLHKQKPTQTEVPHMQMDSYMVAPEITEIIGSYFGAELCSVDVNSDGNTDFLLVGAPLFNQPQEKTQGQIYVYTLTDEVGCDKGSDSVRENWRQTPRDTESFQPVWRVFNVLARLSFQPEEICTETTDCLGNTEENIVLPMVTLTACFEMVETTKSKAGRDLIQWAGNSGLSILCVLSLDPMRETHQAFFSPIDKTARNLTSTLKLRNKDTCFNYPVYRSKCVDDKSSPVSIRLNFFQVDSERASAVLNVDSKRQAVAEITISCLEKSK